MKGICHLSIVPIRKSPSDTSEQTSQLLFGEQVIIEEENGNWYAVKCLHDHYRGWVDKKQISVNLKIEHTEYIVNSTFLQINNKILPLGSFLNNKDLEKENVHPFLASNKIKLYKESNDISQLIINSKKYLNTPYLWGGKTPFGIDCSGFSQMVYRLNGISLKRDAYQQAEMGTEVNSFEHLKTGNLAFFNKGEGDKITHVGIVINDDDNNLQIIHASGWVQINLLNDKGIIDNDGNLSHHYLFSRRIID